MMAIRVRTSGVFEAECLSSIHERCFPHYWDKDVFNDFFSVSGTVALVAELPPSPLKEEGSAAPKRDAEAGAGEGEGEGVIGMVIYRLSHEQADIITIAVLPEFRRQGVARRLMDEALKNVAAQGAERLFLDVEDGNLPAIKLYESLGFLHDRRRRQYYRQQDGTCTDALVMSKKLPVASGQLPV